MLLTNPFEQISQILHFFLLLYDTMSQASFNQWERLLPCGIVYPYAFAYFWAVQQYTVVEHLCLFYCLHFLISSYVFSYVQVIQMNIDESYRRQIAQELKINQSAQCPYVVVCYQSFYDNGVISIILEYMDGGSLLDLLKKVKTIPEPYLAVISKQVRNLKIMYLFGSLSITNIN